MIPAHPKVLQLGKLKELYAGKVIVEEKVDGSQFAFGRAADDGRLVFRSKGRELFAESVDKLFANTVGAVIARASDIAETLRAGEFVYGEAMSAKRHNTLEYERTPQGHLVLFGGTYADGEWWQRSKLERIADHLRFEVVPVIAELELEPNALAENTAKLRALVEGPSMLGGNREGIVIKNYGQTIHYNGQLHPLFCKLVTDDFKEKHNSSWKPGKDVLAELIDGYRSEARWRKAIQRLDEKGELTNTPKDIGALIRSIQEDVWEEEADELAQKLAQHFKSQVLRASTAGFPEWWKERLLDLELAVGE